MFGNLDGVPEAASLPANDAPAVRSPSPVRAHRRLLSRVYGGAARLRRQWYRDHPEAQRRLDRPVVSVGNLTVGGSGKTPVVAHLARLLVEMGERPAILSRGYGRREVADGVVVVRDPDRIHADLARAGDEPLMLARALDGVTVLVSSSRHLAGRLAERRFGCSVHVLDDGFQHLELHRDLDILVTRPADLVDAWPLPAGRLREPIDAAGVADGLVVFEDTESAADRLADSLGVARAFSAARVLEDARLLEPLGRQLSVDPARRVLVVSGVANPDRFLTDVREQGWKVAGHLTFADHHPFTARDVNRILASARQVRADLVLTTEKDVVRLAPHRPFPIAVAWSPMTISIEPPSTFREWLEQWLGRSACA